MRKPQIDVKTIISAMMLLATILGTYYAWSYREEFRDFVRSLPERSMIAPPAAADTAQPDVRQPAR